jgi:hypothetical protein
MRGKIYIGKTNLQFLFVPCIVMKSTNILHSSNCVCIAEIYTFAKSGIASTNLINCGLL